MVRSYRETAKFRNFLHVLNIPFLRSAIAWTARLHAIRRPMRCDGAECPPVSSTVYNTYSQTLLSRDLKDGAPDYAWWPTDDDPTREEEEHYSPSPFFKFLGKWSLDGASTSPHRSSLVGWRLSLLFRHIHFALDRRDEENVTSRKLEGSQNITVGTVLFFFL